MVMEMRKLNPIRRLMKTKAWILLTAPLVLACTITNNDPDPGRKATVASIETFAGIGETFGYQGDGGPANAAHLGWINGISIDQQGSVYIADGGANVIRKVNSSGVISTVAGYFPGFNVSGSNIVVYAGDGGPATSARLNTPLWIATDAGGNLYIIDASNLALRKVDAGGTITTIAGGKDMGYKGDNGPATAASFDNPYGLATDAQGNLYISDSGNHIIRKISTNGTITTIAGTPKQAGYSGDGGLATAAKLNQPRGITVAANGDIYFTDNEAVIRKISGGTITTIAGTGDGGYTGDGGPAIKAKLMAPRGIALMKDGSVVFADAGNNRIRKIALDGTIKTIAGTGSSGFSGDGGEATDAQISNPQGIAVDADDNIYVAESGNSVVRVIKPVK
jgi:sugar lactone lactonase YvrE